MTEKKKPTKLGRPPRQEVSQKQMAATAGVTAQTLINWRVEGVDITDLSQVMERVGKMKEKTHSSEDKQAAELRKIKAQADKLEHELEVQRGKYVSHESQLKAGMQLGIVIKGMFLKIESDLTPRLAGRKASEVAKILREYSRAKLTELSLYDSEIHIPTD
jgi:hypothetical protein